MHHPPSSLLSHEKDDRLTCYFIGPWCDVTVGVQLELHCTLLQPMHETSNPY